MATTNNHKPPAPSVSSAQPVPSTGAAWLEIYHKPLLVVAALIVIVCAVALVWGLHRRQAMAQSFQMLAIANTPAQWEEIIVQHPKSPAAPMAILALASWRYHAGEYDAATVLYQQLNTQHPLHEIRPASELGLAMCMEARGEAVSAIDAFDAFIKAHADHFLIPQALFGKARSLVKAGRAEEARFIYENFIVEHPDSTWTPQAEMALEQMRHSADAQPANTDTETIASHDNS